jgi:hypothetical protein
LSIYGAVADKWLFPEDWCSQDEIDARLRSDQDWANAYHQKYGV